MEIKSVLTNKGLDLKFEDLNYKVNTWTDGFRIGTFVIVVYI